MAISGVLKQLKVIFDVSSPDSCFEVTFVLQELNLQPELSFRPQSLDSNLYFDLQDAAMTEEPTESHACSKSNAIAHCPSIPIINRLHKACTPLS